MRQLLFFKNGQHILADHGHMIIPHGQDPTMKLDVTHATDPEIEQLKINPHDQQLLQKLAQRAKIKIR